MAAVEGWSLPAWLGAAARTGQGNGWPCWVHQSGPRARLFLSKNMLWAARLELFFLSSENENLHMSYVRLFPQSLMQSQGFPHPLGWGRRRKLSSLFPAHRPHTEPKPPLGQQLANFTHPLIPSSRKHNRSDLLTAKIKNYMCYGSGYSLTTHISFYFLY